MGKNITDLPLEILVKITLAMNDIFTLEYWLACCTILEELNPIEKHRCNLTISKWYSIKGMRLYRIKGNRTFSTHKREKLKYNRNETELLNFKLVQVPDENERRRCIYFWRFAYDKRGYEMFIRQFGCIWKNTYH